MASRNFPCSVGTDIVDVARIGRLVRNKKFRQRIFTDEEVRYCRDKKNAAEHFAVRFAAKEAVWKALSSLAEIKGIAHKEIGIRRAPSGQPSVHLSARLKRFEKDIAVSLSHTRAFAIAMAIYQPE